MQLFPTALSPTVTQVTIMVSVMHTRATLFLPETMQEGEALVWLSGHSFW
jgi:hypothetical protein